VSLTSGRRVAVRGTNRLGRSVTVTVEGDELAKHLLHRARKGSLVAPKVRIEGFVRAAG
jgi:hypothetical protein